jgi:hypothetical protein
MLRREGRDHELPHLRKTWRGVYFRAKEVLPVSTLEARLHSESDSVRLSDRLTLERTERDLTTYYGSLELKGVEVHPESWTRLTRQPCDACPSFKRV